MLCKLDAGRTVPSEVMELSFYFDRLDPRMRCQFTLTRRASDAFLRQPKMEGILDDNISFDTVLRVPRYICRPGIIGSVGRRVYLMPERLRLMEWRCPPAEPHFRHFLT